MRQPLTANICPGSSPGTGRRALALAPTGKVGIALTGSEGHQTMNRNVLYLVIGALIVATGVLGYQLYQERQKTHGVEINVGKSGISIEKK